MKKVIIFGTGDFAQVVHYYLTHDSQYEIIAFTANKQFINNEKLFGLPVVPFEEIESKYPPTDFAMFIAIAYSKINKTRASIFQEAKNKGYDLISYINSKTITWDDLTIGENCFIFENVVIQPFVKIGNDVIIWSGSFFNSHKK